MVCVNSNQRGKSGIVGYLSMTRVGQRGRQDEANYHKVGTSN